MAKTTRTSKSTKGSARNRSPAGKPKGKAQGVKPKPNTKEPMEFRLKIKPEIEVFWSFNAQGWVVFVEAETGKKMAKKVSGLLTAAKLATQVKEKGDVNPSHWDSGIKKHMEDVIGSDYIRDTLLGVTGLTQGRTDRNEDAVWHVFINGLDMGRDETPPTLWSCPARHFTRTELILLKRLVDAFQAGHNYAITTIGGKPKRKRR